MKTLDLYDIDFTAHYFVPLCVAERVNLEFGVMFYNPHNKVPIECTISKGMYDKVSVVPLESESDAWLFKPENYYADDFNSLLEQGIIIKKETETQHLEPITEWEPLTHNTYIAHSGYVVAE